MENENNEKEITCDLIEKKSSEELDYLIAIENTETAITSMLVWLSEQKDLESALAAFYVYGNKATHFFETASVSSVLKEIYNNNEKTVSEKIPNALGVKDSNAYLFDFVVNILPKLRAKGLTSGKYLSELIRQDGILSVAIREMFENKERILRGINTTYDIKLRGSGGSTEQKEQVKKDREAAISSYNENFNTMMDEVTSTFGESDNQFINDTLLDFIAKINSGTSPQQLLGGGETENTSSFNKEDKILLFKKMEEMLNAGDSITEFLENIDKDIGSIPQKTKETLPSKDDIQSLLENLKKEIFEKLPGERYTYPIGQETEEREKNNTSFDNIETSPLLKEEQTDNLRDTVKSLLEDFIEDIKTQLSSFKEQSQKEDSEETQEIDFSKIEQLVSKEASAIKDTLEEMIEYNEEKDKADNNKEQRENNNTKQVDYTDAFSNIEERLRIQNNTIEAQDEKITELLELVKNEINESKRLRTQINQRSNTETNNSVLKQEEDFKVKFESEDV